MPPALPEFANPPVAEVALSVQFERLDTSVAHLGLLWQRFRDRFGQVEEKPELPPAFERFGPPEKRMPGVRFEVGAVPGLRLWFLNEQGSELIQVQRDRFIRNWRKTEDQGDYPRYDNLRGAFADDLQTFSSFVADEFQATLVPNQCEVTYVNIIEAADSGRLSRILACVSETHSDDSLGEPEESEVQFRFVLKDGPDKPWGRLHVVAAPAMRKSDNQPVVRLSLTARGAPPNQDIDGALKVLDAGHEALVRGFASITTPEMLTAWGRKV